MEVVLAVVLNTRMMYSSTNLNKEISLYSLDTRYFHLWQLSWNSLDHWSSFSLCCVHILFFLSHFMCFCILKKEMVIQLGCMWVMSLSSVIKKYFAPNLPQLVHGSNGNWTIYTSNSGRSIWKWYNSIINRQLYNLCKWKNMSP